MSGLGLDLEEDLETLMYSAKKVIPSMFQAATNGGDELVVQTRMADVLTALDNLLAFARGGQSDHVDVRSLKAAVETASDLLYAILCETHGYTDDARVVFKGFSK